MVLLRPLLARVGLRGRGGGAKVAAAPADAVETETRTAGAGGGGDGGDVVLLRFTWAYNRASGAMLVTSCTSGIAFLATAISPIPAVRSFGITMFFMILVDYLFVITLFAAAVVANERYVASWARRYGCSACDPYNLVVRCLGGLRARNGARGADA